MPAFAPRPRLLPLLAWLADLLVGGGCHRHGSTSSDAPATSASVVTIGVALGTCDDVTICERECSGGSGDRCRRLAATYALGRGVPRDEARAATLYDGACKMDDAPACVFAGRAHEYAHGVPKDDGKAARLYARACELKWPAGCYNLAIMVENGRGVPQDHAKARDLYQLACGAGAKQACERVHQDRGAPETHD